MASTVQAAMSLSVSSCLWCDIHPSFKANSRKKQEESDWRKKRTEAARNERSTLEGREGQWLSSALSLHMKAPCRTLGHGPNPQNIPVVWLNIKPNRTNKRSNKTNRFVATCRAYLKVPIEQCPWSKTHQPRDRPPFLSRRNDIRCNMHIPPH